MFWLLLLVTMLLIPTLVALRVWWELRSVAPTTLVEGVPMDVATQRDLA